MLLTEKINMHYCFIRYTDNNKVIALISTPFPPQSDPTIRGYRCMRMRHKLYT